ncbi:MAG TPA: cytochrome P450 [Microbacterium sp.]|nr:cytochrome P450 [Microbacterium sp.]
MTETLAPVADWVELQKLVEDPYPTYARLRDEAPVAYVPQLDRYLLTTFRDCFDAEMDQDTFSASEDPARSTMVRSMGRPMLRKDDPEHKQERNAMAPALKPVTIKRFWREQFDEVATRYIARLRDAGDEADLATDFAIPFAADNLSIMIGFTGIAPDTLMRWSHALIRGTGNVADDPLIWAETDVVRAEIDEAIDRTLRDSDDSGPSIISTMRRAGAGDEQLRANIRLTISGGMNEPSHVISSAVWCLSTNPDQRRLVETGERTWRDVFEETARYQSPVGMYPRRTTRDVELRGVHIPAQSTVSLVIASANRDEDQFHEPDAFDLQRESASHLAFGNGTHICAGNWAARSMIGEVALPRLYAEFPDIDVPEPDAVPFRGWVFRGPTSVPVSL